MTNTMLKSLTAAGVALALAFALGCDDPKDGPNNTSSCPTALDTILISAPHAGDTLHVGQAVTVSWCLPTDNSIEGVLVKFSGNAGDTWRDVVTSAVFKPALSFTWTPDSATVDGFIAVGSYTDYTATEEVVGPFVVLAQ